MLKVFTYYDERVKNFFAKSIKSIAYVLDSENLDLIILTSSKIPRRELEIISRFFNNVSIKEVNVHLTPLGTSTQSEENPYFVEFLLANNEYNRLYVDPRLFLMNQFSIPANSNLFFKQHQGNLSTKLCYIRSGDQFSSIFSAIRRSSISSITDIELSYVIKNNFLISKKISQKQIVSGKLLNDSNIAALQTDNVAAIDTTGIDDRISKKVISMINDYSRKQTLITLSSFKKKKTQNFSELQQPASTTTTENPVKKSFSIIITAYKTADYIEECLDSIENQSYFSGYDDFEVLVGVDACQETLNKVQSIRKKYRNLSVYMMLENSGTYITTNTLISLAKNDYIIRFDSDDVMMNFLVYEVAQKMNSSDILRLGYYNFYQDTKKISARVDIAHGVVCFKKELIDKQFGGYKPWSCAADSELIVRAAEYCRVVKLDTPVFYRRVHSSSLTRQTDTGLESDVRKKYRAMIKTKYFLEDVYIDRVTVNCKKIELV